MILTINASQIAPCKENIADPVVPANNRLFSPVDANCGDIHSGICFAVSSWPFKTVYPASSWT
jgi:hypothetical protein